MLVIGHNQTTFKNHIIVSYWHKGHLGLIPGTKVKITQPNPSQNGCEVLISSFDTEHSNLFGLQCVFQEKQGVVGKILEAITKLNLNILSLESATTERTQKHVVYMILDWSSAGPDYAKKVEILPGTWNKLKPIHSLLPDNDRRYADLILSLLLDAHDVIDWTTQEESLPQISIFPFGQSDPPHFSSDGVAISEKAFFEEFREKVVKTNFKKNFNLDGQGRNSLIEIPDGIFKKVKQCVHKQDHDDISYILLSDTRTRSIKAFFPSRDIEEYLLHIGIIHENIPGALAAIADIIRSDFNILISLIRKEDATQNVWEAVVHFTKKEKPPKGVGARLTWFVKKLENAESYSKRRAAYFDLKVTTPKYPISQRRSPSLHIKLYNESLSNSEKEKERKDIEKKKKDKKNADEKREFDLTKMHVSRRGIMKLVDSKSRQKPVVFVSYSRSSPRHGEIVMKQLQRAGFTPIDYQEPDFNVALEEAVSRIRDADYFVGIWHSDKDHDEEVSPWLPFELGIALAFDKDYRLLMRNSLKRDIKSRIVKDRTIPEYEDVMFEKETVKQLISSCSASWLETR